MHKRSVNALNQLNILQNAVTVKLGKDYSPLIKHGC